MIAPTEINASAIAAPRTQSNSFAARLLRHRLAQIGVFIIAALIFVAIFAPVISRVDPRVTQPNALSDLGAPHAPGSSFLLGADTLGRDVWTRMLYGTRVSLIIALCAMFTATVIGTTIGLLSGYFGGWVDIVLMRFTEIIFSLPTILLAIALASVLPDDPIVLPNIVPAFIERLLILWPGGPILLPSDMILDRKLLNLLLAIALVTWTGIARAVRGEVLSIKERPFVEAAHAMGCSHGRILRVHLLPNVLPTIITLATLATANNILLEAGLSFLNLGVEPSTPSWGGMISEGQPWILSAPWIILAPGIAVVVAVMGFNLLGQAMQETLDRR